MDPELEKIRHNVAAYKQAIAAGTHTQADLDAYLKEVGHLGTPFVDAKPDESETAGDRAAGVISAAYQGLTLGAGNKITAAMRAYGLPRQLGGTKGFDFSTALKEQTDVLEGYRGRHPVEAGAMELAGSIPTIMATGGAGATGVVPEVASEVSTGRRVLQTAKTGAKVVGAGAAYGGASGALSSNTLADIPSNAIEGAEMGAIAAPVVAIAGASAGALARGGARALRRAAPTSAITEAIVRKLGAGPATPDEQAGAALIGALKRGGVDPETVAITKDSPTTAMELGSRNVPALVRQARNVPTSNAAQTTDRFLGERSARAGKRIEDRLVDATGARITDVDEPIDRLIQKRGQSAAPLYEKAEGYGPIQNPETVAQIKALRKHPDFAAAWERGQRLDALERGTTENTPSAQPTVAQINAWKKGLDAMIESRAGSSNALSKSEARVYRQKLNDILDAVDAEVPDFKAARADFKGNSELKEAAELGAAHFNPSNSAAYLKRTMADLSPGEQAAYRANALNDVVARVRKLGANEDIPEAARRVNIPQRLFGTHDAGERLRMLFPDNGSYEQFLSTLEQESLYPKTHQFLGQQSSTAAQLAEAGTDPALWRDAGLASVGSMSAKGRLANAAFETLTGRGKKMTPAVADAVAQKATLTGDALENALRALSASERKRLGARSATSGLLRNTVAGYLPDR